MDDLLKLIIESDKTTDEKIKLIKNVLDLKTDKRKELVAFPLITGPAIETINKPITK